MVFSSNCVTIIFHVLSIIAGEVVRRMNNFAHDPRSNSQAPKTYVILHGCWLKEFDDL